MGADPTVRFLIGGVQKGGTTALFEHLNRHPALQMAACKEVHFFDRESGVDWAAPDYGAYHDAFAAPDGRLRGEATPIYLYWPPSLPRIRAYEPDMRLIFLFRDPVERAYSHWKHSLFHGFDTMPFAEAVRAGRARVDDPEFPGHHRHFSYVERGFYGAQLERALTLFPRERILCLDSDALGAEPNGVLDRVCAFLGIPPFAAPQPPLRANVLHAPGTYGPMPDADRDHLRALFAEDQRRFTALTGIDFLRGWG